MSQDTFQRVLSQIKTLKTSVHLQGWGEPLLHPETFAHIKNLKELGSTVSFTTNGTLMSKSISEALMNCSLDGLTFSMAGIASKTQDSIRGRGSFDLLKSSMKTFLDVRQASAKTGPAVAVSYLLTPKTVLELPEAVTWCRKHGVDNFVTVFLTQACCRSQLELQFLPSKKAAQKLQFIRMRSYLKTIFSKMKLNLKEFKPMLTPVCDKNPLHSLFISANGDVSPCVFLCPPIITQINWQYKDIEVKLKPLSFGNINHTSLQEIWLSPDYQNFRKQFRKRLEFHDKKLSAVSYSLSGSAELDIAVKSIKRYFMVHPPPAQCAACAKLGGF